MDELWLERMAEVLCCDKDPAAVVVAVNELQEQLASAKRMIAKLRGRGDCGSLAIPDLMTPNLMMFGKQLREIDDLCRGVILQPEDKFLSINGVGEVAIPDGAGVLPVTSSLGISGTLDIKENKELGLRKLVGYQFTQRHSVKGNGE